MYFPHSNKTFMVIIFWFDWFLLLQKSKLVLILFSSRVGDEDGVAIASCKAGLHLLLTDALFGSIFIFKYFVFQKVPKTSMYPLIRF